DATPSPSWALYVPKVLAVWALTLGLLAVGVAFSAAYQTAQGYTAYEWGVYAGTLVLQYALPAMMVAVLSVTIQVLSPNKYAGMLIFVLYIVASLTMAELGFEHHLWRFSEGPEAIYSDLNGFGHFLAPLLWYSLYWSGATIVLLVLGFGLWRRGAVVRLRERLPRLATTMDRPGAATALLGLVTFATAGAYLFHTTRVTNEFLTTDQRYDRYADYERTLKPFDALPTPAVTAVTVAIDIFPAERRIHASGSYTVQNRTDKPLEQVLIGAAPANALTIDAEGLGEARRFAGLNTALYAFDPPLEPGEARRLGFTVERDNPGFTDGSEDNAVAANGTFINNQQLLPRLGYVSLYQLVDRHERKKRGLPPPERLPALEDAAAQHRTVLGADAQFAMLDITVSTDEDQLAIAPGYLEREWVEGGRRHFRYVMDAPSLNYFAVQSARYAVARDAHEGVAIEVYHHPEHHRNVARMIEAV
ncbi:MAG: hypothetical protein AAGD86_14205, partial [Pseudomonadota bacterium]